MELMFESRIEVTRTGGRIDALQEKPEMLPEPVLSPNGESDGNRVQVGTVLKDGGTYRMWYRAFPKSNDPKPRVMAAYAESEDGLEWQRRKLDMVKGVPFDNNYIDLGVSTIFIDPDSPSSQRYRAVGYLRALRQVWAESGEDPQGAFSSFYTAHSPDGLHWEMDSPEPRWFSGDTVRCAYHENRRCGMVAMKFVRRVNGIHRRAIWTAELRDGVWGDAVCGLVPDAFDDTAAVARGFVSADYYEMGMMATGQGTVGFLNRFLHHLPLSQNPANHALYGQADISLVYQAHPGDAWLFPAGRPTFIGSGEQPWNTGWTGPSSTVVDISDSHVLYLTGATFDHGWTRNLDWSRNEERERLCDEAGYHSVIGLARWPKWRLFGLKGNAEGWIDLELGRIEQPSELVLNYRAGFAGSVRVQIYNRKIRGDCLDIKGRSAEEEVIPLTGDSIGEVVQWKSGSMIEPQDGRCLAARITLGNAAVYAWELRPLGSV